MQVPIYTSPDYTLLPAVALGVFTLNRVLAGKY